MYVLDKLWLGNLTHSEGHFRRGSKYASACARLANIEDDLRGRLNTENTGMFDALQEAQNELNQMNEYESFVAGFQLGAKITLDVLGDNLSLPSQASSS